MEIYYPKTTGLITNKIDSGGGIRKRTFWKILINFLLNTDTSLGGR